MMTPGTIYGIGRNYAEHAAELGNPVSEEPLVFLKSPACLRPVSHGPLAFSHEEFHHEVELVVMLGRDLELGHQGSWHDVEALTLGLDLTRRGIQQELKKKGHPWTLAKSFTGSAVVGPFMPRADVLTVDNIHFSLDVNGEPRQLGETRDMLFPVPILITYLASFNLLRRGDLIFTGTPKGVGPMRKGDRFTMMSPELKLNITGVL